MSGQNRKNTLNATVSAELLVGAYSADYPLFQAPKFTYLRSDYDTCHPVLALAGTLNVGKLGASAVLWKNAHKRGRE